MTREQVAAREAISLIEGNLAGIMDDRTLVLETFDGRLYRVDEDASHIQRIEPDGTVRTTDLVQLEAEADPMWTEREDVDPYAFDPFAREDLRGVPDDFHSDREAERVDFWRKVEDDKRYWRESGEAA